MSENDLEEMFSPYGQVVSTRILRNASGISRGVGFCRMQQKEACEKIIDDYNGKCMPGKTMGGFFVVTMMESVCQVIQWKGSL